MSQPAPAKLSARTILIVTMLAQGSNAKEIAIALDRSHWTITDYIKLAHKAKGARTNAALVWAAIRDGDIPNPAVCPEVAT